MQGSTFLMQRSRDVTLQYWKFPGRLDRLEKNRCTLPKLPVACNSHVIRTESTTDYTLSSPNRNKKMLLSAEGTLTNHPFNQPRNRETIRPSCPFNQHCSLQPCICSLSASCFASCCAASSKRRASTRAWCF